MRCFFFYKKRRSKYVKAIFLNSCGRTMKYTFFFLLETQKQQETLKKRNSGQYFRLGKNEFLSCLGEDWCQFSPSQLWTWFQSGADFLRLVSVGNINMVANCYGWSQVLLKSLQCCISD